MPANTEKISNVTVGIGWNLEINHALYKAVNCARKGWKKETVA